MCSRWLTCAHLHLLSRGLCHVVQTLLEMAARGRPGQVQTQSCRSSSEVEGVVLQAAETGLYLTAAASRLPYILLGAHTQLCIVYSRHCRCRRVQQSCKACAADAMRHPQITPTSNQFQCLPHPVRHPCTKHPCTGGARASRGARQVRNPGAYDRAILLHVLRPEPSHQKKAPAQGPIRHSTNRGYKRGESMLRLHSSRGCCV